MKMKMKLRMKVIRCDIACENNLKIENEVEENNWMYKRR